MVDVSGKALASARYRYSTPEWPLLPVAQGGERRLSLSGYGSKSVMQIDITIVSDKSPGVLARVIVALRKAGLNLTQQQMVEADDHRVFTLSAQGLGADKGQLKGTIEAIAGVNSVQMAGLAEAAAPVAEPAVTASSEGSLAQRLAQQFPAIGDAVEQYQADLPAASASELLFALGKEVAEHRLKVLPSVADDVSIKAFINERLLPDLAELADAERDGDQLKVLSSIFSKGKKASGFGYPMGGAGTLIKCDFLSGYIQGLLEAVPALRYGHVEEVMCRKEGQPYCLFEFVLN